MVCIAHEDFEIVELSKSQTDDLKFWNFNETSGNLKNVFGALAFSPVVRSFMTVTPALVIVAVDVARGETGSFYQSTTAFITKCGTLFFFYSCYHWHSCY